MSCRRTGSISVVVPVFNEADRLGRTVEPLIEFVRARGDGSELLFADDGSTDDTLAVLEKHAGTAPDLVRVLRLPHRGKGAAVQAGLLAARGEVAAFCDVDLATPLSEL